MKHTSKKEIRLKQIADHREVMTGKQLLGQRVFALGVRILVETFAVGGAISSCARAFTVEFDLALFLALTLMLCALMEVLSHLQKRFVGTFPIAAVLLGVVIFVFRTDVYYSFLKLLNVISEHFCGYYGIPHVAYVIGGTVSSLGMTFLLALFALVLEIVVLYVVKERGPRWLYILVTLPIVVSPYVVGQAVEGVGLVFYTGATAAIVGSRVIRHENGHVVRKKNFTEHSVQALILVFFGLMALLTFVIFTPTDYEEHFDAKQIKHQLQESFKDFENDIFSIFVTDTSSALYSGGLNNGALGWVDQVNYKNEEALKVTLPQEMETLSNRGLFLREYVGDEYTSDKIETLTREDRQAYEVLQNKYDQNLDNISQLYLSSGILDSEVAAAFAAAEPFAGEGQSTEGLLGSAANLLLRTENGVLSRQDSLKDIQVTNIWTNINDYFLPYFTEELIERGHDGRVVPSISKMKEDSYTLSTYYPIYSSLYRQLQKKNNKNKTTFSLMTIREAYVLEQAIMKHTKKSLEEYLASQADETVEVKNLLVEAGYSENLVIEASVAAGAISLRKLVQAVYDVRQFGVMENEYRQWVHDTYLKLPENSADNLLEDMKKHQQKDAFISKEGQKYTAPGEIGGISEKSISAAIRYVRKYISKDTEYDLAPGALPEGEDFVDYFLNHSKKGYCVHYAAAGMLAFRALGIPARYVEGFLVGVENYDTGQKNADGTISMTLTDINAHAWVEIYVDGFGWYPVEMTPGYYSDQKGNVTAEERQGTSAEEDQKEPENTEPPETEEPQPEESEEPQPSEEPESDEAELDPVQPEVDEATPPPGMMEWADQEYGDQEERDSGEIQIPEVESRSVPAWLWILIACLGTVLAIVTGVVIWQKRLYDRGRRAMNAPNKSERVVYTYVMLCSVLEGRRESHEEKSPGKEWKDFEALAEKAYFSNTEVSEEEWLLARSYYKKKRKELYQTAGIKEKVRYRCKGL